MLVRLIKTDMTEKVFTKEKRGLRKVGEIFEATSNKVSWIPQYYKDIENGLMYHHEDIQEVGSVLSELERFQTDRLLHKNTFDLRIATMNILEELLEAHGVGDNKERVLVSDMYRVFEQIVSYAKNNKDWLDNYKYTYLEPTIEEQVDAFCDIQVFAGGEIGKLGYSNEQCLIEVGKEINSRTGEIVNGKFEKYKTEDAMAKWYKADFSGCKLCI